jgi:hypothetical protein
MKSYEIDELWRMLRLNGPADEALDKLKDRVENALDDFMAKFDAAAKHDLAVAGLRQAAVDRQPVPQRIVIRVASRSDSDLFVTGVSFADGDGYRIRRFSYTPDRRKAHVFNPECGVAVARQIALRVKGVTLQEA